MRLGPYLPHEPGAKMTVVKQTPSNDWVGMYIFEIEMPVNGLNSTFWRNYLSFCSLELPNERLIKQSCVRF